MHKRLKKDLKELISLKYNVFYDKTLNEKNFDYHILWCFKRKIPTDIIRDDLLSFLQTPLTLPLNNIQSKFKIKSIIKNKPFNIKFNIPKDFPFKSPKFTINNHGGYQLKNIKNDKKTQDLLIDMFSIFLNEWSPMLTLKNCIDQIILAIEIHMTLSYKSKIIK